MDNVLVVVDKELRIHLTQAETVLKPSAKPAETHKDIRYDLEYENRDQ